MPRTAAEIIREAVTRFGVPAGVNVRTYRRDTDTVEARRWGICEAVSEGRSAQQVAIAFRKLGGDGLNHKTAHYAVRREAASRGVQISSLTELKALASRSVEC